ncbi:MAG TPA: PhoD-like phosphatase N-terminal domain-containing protein, partial [Woeseiaceae bacterium]|nr:PhoD-like phosphatase N-terminal domain-containing protein [Woeseiaceae bacterium]
MRLTRRRFVTHLLPGTALALALPPAKASAAASFVHGVASGDPGATGVLLWTRVTPRFGKETEVAWELAADPEFERILRKGTTAALPERDYTVKVEVEGLEPGRDYFYRFHALGAVSRTGRTLTLPVGPVERFVLAACSCSNYPAGYFNAYRAMAQTD